MLSAAAAALVLDLVDTLLVVLVVELEDKDANSRLSLNSFLYPHIATTSLMCSWTLGLS